MAVSVLSFTQVKKITLKVVPMILFVTVVVKSRGVGFAIHLMDNF